MKHIFTHDTGSRWLTRWYLGIFILVLVILMLAIYREIREEKWRAFDFGVARLGEEMIEEVFKVREKFNVSESDIIAWTPGQLDKLAANVRKELVDESIDNGLPEPGYVIISDPVSSRILFRSPEITERQVDFHTVENPYWGYHIFKMQGDGNRIVTGVGYAGSRIEKDYYAGVFDPGSKSQLDGSRLKELKNLTAMLMESVGRIADSLYLKNPDSLAKCLSGATAGAYFYLFDMDTVYWSWNLPDRSVIFKPMIPPIKESYFHITDMHDRRYTQYLLIDDESILYNYKIDLFVPEDSVRAALNQTAAFLTLTSLFLLLFVWLGGKYLVRKALRPVDDLIREVHTITLSNMEGRLPVPEFNDAIRRLVEIFNELLDRLAQSYNVRKTFIADASHELKTPLTIMMADLETAFKALDGDAADRSNLLACADEVNRMARIVDDLGWLARTDAGQIAPRMEPLRLDEVLMTTMSRCQTLAGRKNIEIRIGEMHIIETMGDEELLVRALSNLVENAVKYSKNGERVELSLMSKDRQAWFMVADQGCGIPEDEVDKIFDRFYRVDISRSRDTGGSGLGLAIARGIADIHQGRITVRSGLGKGSTFILTIPIGIPSKG